MIFLFKFSPDNKNDSQLHYAVRTGDERILKRLLKSGADPVSCGHKGKTPLDICDDPTLKILLKDFA